MGKKLTHYTDCLYYDLEQTAKFFRFFSLAVFKKLDTNITFDEFITLDTILCNAGICQRDLAKLMLKDRANTGRILNSLEEKGYIARFVDMKNNRLVRKMGVTEKGKDHFDNITIQFETHLSNLVQETVPEEDVQNVRITLKKIRENLSKVVDMQI